jgi:hypothetical protein
MRIQKTGRKFSKARAVLILGALALMVLPVPGTPSAWADNNDNEDECQEGCKGAAGANGKDGKDGKDFKMDESLALNAALSLPSWLEKGEQYSLTGGAGFSEGAETAVGVTGIVRMDGGTAGFIGGAVSTDGGTWARKAGVRVGW